MHRLHTLCGVSTGLSGAALLELLRRVDWPSAIAFAGSAIATVASWLISRRAEIRRQTLDLDREERQAARDEQIAALVHQLRVRQIESGQYPAPAPETTPCASPSTSPSPA